MRIRQIKPDFFFDPDMAQLSPRQRLIYIGLWCIADDAGWLPRIDYVEIGRELFGFDTPRYREAWVLDALYALLERGSVEVELCGHGYIPSFTKHQRFAGLTKRVYTFTKEHESRCIPRASGGDPQEPANPRGDPRVEHRNGRELGTERNGKGAHARDDDSEFRSKVQWPAPAPAEARSH